MKYMDIKPAPKTAWGLHENWKANLESSLRANSLRAKKIQVKHDNFWDSQLSDSEGALYIDGEHYRLGNETADKRFKGYGGVEHQIRLLDTDEVITTTNLWHQGRIPKWYGIKDNAEFIV